MAGRRNPPTMQPTISETSVNFPPPNLSPVWRQSLTRLSKEIAGRTRAKQDLLTFASAIEIPGAPLRPDDEACEEFRPVSAAFGKHQLLWLNCLQRVQDGEIARLMGLMPPGSAKSTYTSIVFPVHTMARFARTQIIVANYGSDLPRRWGRKARSIVKQRIFQRIFDTQLSAESAAADEWALTNGSEYMGAGLLTGITGNRADGVIWDDLIKGREQADSALIRQKTWEAYFDDLLTRKKPRAFEIGITTRWHEDDVAGRILPEGYGGESGFIDCRDGNRWYVVCIPAEAERDDDILGRSRGERIWPEWFGENHFAPFKRNARTWAALYQQRPAPEEGDYFKNDWLKPIERLPARHGLRVYGGSDYAVTADGGDYTVHVVVGLDVEGRMYLLDLWRRRAASDQWVEAFCDLVAAWRPIGWAEEQGQIKSGVGPFLDKRMRERKVYVARERFGTRGDKAVRAQSIRGRMALEGLYVPAAAPWLADFRAELLSFPAGRHDDQVDALGLVGQLLDRMLTPPRSRPHDKPLRDRWDVEPAVEINWKTI
jgi:predicted phage terminase large subunit-like protein